MRTSFPNTFVVGAAKCGTTSLVSKLGRHPDVFVPAVKEPFYFSFPEIRPNWTGPGDPNELPVYTLEDYLALYRTGTARRVKIDGSTSYLYDCKVPTRVLKAVPDAKIIAILRHPVDRAYSAFLHVRRRTTEEGTDFGAALAMEGERISAGYEHLWHYRAMSCYSQQLKRWYECFAAEQIKVLLYDDLLDRPQHLFKEVCLWLGLNPESLPAQESRENVSAVPRNIFLKRFLLSRNPIKIMLARSLPKSLRQTLWKLNSHKPKCPEHLRISLMREFADDVVETQKIIGRDLSHWFPDELKQPTK